MLSDYTIYSLNILNYLAFAYVLDIVYYLLLFPTSLTLKMGIKILQKLSTLCYEVFAGNYNKLKQIFTKYKNNKIDILMTAKLF